MQHVAISKTKYIIVRAEPHELFGRAVSLQRWHPVTLVKMTRHYSSNTRAFSLRVKIALHVTVYNEIMIQRIKL